VEVDLMSATKAATPAAVRKRMTSGELATWRSLVDLTAELHRLLSTQLQEIGLSSPDYQVLLALAEADGRRLRSSELAASIEWERSRLSHHLGRMERRGLIRRDDCATDNRGAEVSLTDEGAERFRQATVPHTRAIKQYFADALTPDQFHALADVLHSLDGHLHPEHLISNGSQP
jgi:DNA-binding MarR family transcriptional regulator